MYKFIEGKEIIGMTKIAEKVGIDLSTLSRIVHGKQTTSKMTAYCIVKCINKNAEIKDYFIKLR